MRVCHSVCPELGPLISHSTSQGRFCFVPRSPQPPLLLLCPGCHPVIYMLVCGPRTQSRTWFPSFRKLNPKTTKTNEGQEGRSPQRLGMGNEGHQLGLSPPWVAFSPLGPGCDGAQILLSQVACLTSSKTACGGLGCGSVGRALG